ncbi:MAG TPA: complex I subunit 1 family protein [Chthoniobacteraceae bacterium]|jgi:NADH-quinone oxidoreductase subunit H|nr:complex I subunit 1 family protein [Chthoniobacteraceae bacterium]
MDFLSSIDWYLILTSLAKTVFVLIVVLTMVSYTVYAERRVSALIQDRLGPNRVGFPTTLLGTKKDFSPFLGGLGQPIADAVKLLIKEDFTPAHVNKFYYWIAPALGIGSVVVSLAVIPFGSTFFGAKMVIANIGIGPLFIFAFSSLGVYGIVLAGWSANSKYPFLGSIRSSSQMISYELALGLSVVPLFLILGTLNLSDIVDYQVKHGWLLFPFIADGLHIPTLSQWLLWIPVAISFVIFTISMFAETNRLPFDLPEAETELVGGYHTEYSSMKFALFFLGEYAAMIAGSSLIVTLFLGGWHFPGIPDGSGNGGLEILHAIPAWIWGLVNIAVFFGKVAVLLLFFIWVRWTLPRFRYDQLMRLGWIFFFEIALVNVFVAAFIVALIPN